MSRQFRVSPTRSVRWSIDATSSFSSSCAHVAAVAKAPGNAALQRRRCSRSAAGSSAAGRSFGRGCCKVVAAQLIKSLPPLGRALAYAALARAVMQPDIWRHRSASGAVRALDLSRAASMSVSPHVSAHAISRRSSAQWSPLDCGRPNAAPRGSYRQACSIFASLHHRR
jgi:hypothetical protein